MTQTNPHDAAATTSSQRNGDADRARRFDVAQLRADFPILSTEVHGRPLVYLDNAATTQRPRAVIDAVRHFYECCNANVHRGLHALSEEATSAYEAARGTIANFFNLVEPRQVVFTRGTTEAVNLVAHAWAGRSLRPGDEVLITHMEHHGNLVPWRVACDRAGATLRVAPVDDAGQLDMRGFESLLNSKTKLVAAAHVSNVLGTVNPVREMTRLAHDAGALVLLDGAQALAHGPVDLGEIGCDFYAFSGHKCFGPMGIGALIGRFDLLSQMPPFQTGGEMIDNVTFEKVDFAEPPMRFEAGTPNVAGAVGLGVALDYLQALHQSGLACHEADLVAHATAALGEVAGLRLIGTAKDKCPVFSFTIDGMHPYDLAPILDRQGVAVRTGHHCAQPLMERFGVSATVRASLAAYNRREEVDTLVEAIAKARRMLL